MKWMEETDYTLLILEKESMFQRLSDVMFHMLKYVALLYSRFNLGLLDLIGNCPT